MRGLIPQSVAKTVLLGVRSRLRHVVLLSLAVVPTGRAPWRVDFHVDPKEESPADHHMTAGTASLGFDLKASAAAFLGPVEIHRVRIIVAPMWIMASKLVSVLQARIAIRLNSLSF